MKDSTIANNHAATERNGMQTPIGPIRGSRGPLTPGFFRRGRNPACLAEAANVSLNVHAAAERIPATESSSGRRCAHPGFFHKRKSAPPSRMYLSIPHVPDLGHLISPNIHAGLPGARANAAECRVSRTLISPNVYAGVERIAFSLSRICVRLQDSVCIPAAERPRTGFRNVPYRGRAQILRSATGLRFHSPDFALARRISRRGGLATC
jgi:hypothetical protein